MIRRILFALASAGAVAWGCTHGDVTGPGAGQGMLSVQLTDAPLPLDSIKEVNVFVERIDARRARGIAAAVDLDLDGDHREDHEHPDSSRWVTIATPNAAFNILALQGGATAFLGTTPVDTGSFKAIRLIIDPARSNVVLRDGTVLTSTSNPPVEFENRNRHALFVEFDDTAEVSEGETATVMLDFRLAESLSLRGRSVHDGFLFRPVVLGHCDRRHH